MRRLAIIIFIATFCCLFACLSRHDYGNDGAVHSKRSKLEEPAKGPYDWKKYIIKDIHIDEPRINLTLLKYELKDDPIKILPMTLVFGPDSLMTRVIDIGPNPFGRTCEVSFILLAPDTITVDLQDVKRSDTEPIRLFREYLDAAEYRLQIGETNLPPSSYSFQFTVGNITKSCVGPLSF